MSAANLSDSEQQTLRDATKILKRMWEQGESSRCQWCGHPYSAREMRQHVPKCPKKPL